MVNQAEIQRYLIQNGRTPYVELDNKKFSNLNQLREHIKEKLKQKRRPAKRRKQIKTSIW